MFNHDEIAQQLIGTMSNYLSRLLQDLFVGGAELSPTIDPSQPWQVAIFTVSPIPDQVKTLCQVANGEVDRDSANEFFVGEVAEIIQSLCELQFSTPGAYAYEIPEWFWESDLGSVIQACQIWIANSELITLTEAAQFLYPGIDIQTARMRVKRAIERGDLRSYTSSEENNPQHDLRLLRSEVEAFSKSNDN